MSVADTLVKNKITEKKKKALLDDYRLACESRHASLIGRKEVFMGKAKFGIFGDGKELAQIVMAKFFEPGDIRSGYYRDQTFMLAIGALTLEQYFAQLYAHTDIEADPASAGRLMNGHFATRMLDDEGNFKNLTEQRNSSSDISPTAGQMPRLLGLAYASKLFRELPELKEFNHLSKNGNEVAFGTIGNASTSEGMFFETVNAGGVLQVPMVISVWDDDYGISVPQKYHTTKESISKALIGFQRTETEPGYEIEVVRGWDYPALMKTYKKVVAVSRKEHVPGLIHVIEMTQPQGHSTSGSHERYKSEERLAWEKDHDCIKKFGEYLTKIGVSTHDDLKEIDNQAAKTARAARDKAWKAFTSSIKEDHDAALRVIKNLAARSSKGKEIDQIRKELEVTLNPLRLDAFRAMKRAIRQTINDPASIREEALEWITNITKENHERFSSHLFSQSPESALNVEHLPPEYSEESPKVDGREVLQACFDAALSRDPRVFAFGEDVGMIGDVNQAFAGLQEKYGELRVTDTGIREVTIIGQGIGAALRGLRPISEIQYLDYLIYAMATLSDDLACLQYRTRGGQKAPLIIRTRGHRLEGVWHSGSPIGMILNSLKGIYLLAPRNMTQAAGFYNTMLKSDDPCIIIECLNGYRLKERLPENIGTFTVPLGIPEIIREGSDITIVTYGSMCRVVVEAAEALKEFDIDCEVIDAQTLMPFDIHHSIVESVKKTHKVIFADEDVPGGASAFMMQNVLETQGGYWHLDAEPVTISANDHRPAYASDGDYFSKPNSETVFDAVYKIMHESNPAKFPDLG